MSRQVIILIIRYLIVFPSFFIFGCSKNMEGNLNQKSSMHNVNNYENKDVSIQNAIYYLINTRTKKQIDSEYRDAVLNMTFFWLLKANTSEIIINIKAVSIGENGMPAPPISSGSRQRENTVFSCKISLQDLEYIAKGSGVKFDGNDFRKNRANFSAKELDDKAYQWQYNIYTQNKVWEFCNKK